MSLVEVLKLSHDNSISLLVHSESSVLFKMNVGLNQKNLC